MFEKEAEENINKNKIELSKILDSIGIDFVLSSLGQKLKNVFKRIWQDGAEFGYNKANEWHYVKDELPPENVLLDIITLDENKKRKVWVGEYKGGNGNYWTGYFNHYIDVPYAWKEIVLPELKESK